MMVYGQSGCRVEGSPEAPRGEYVQLGTLMEVTSILAFRHMSL